VQVQQRQQQLSIPIVSGIKTIHHYIMTRHRRFATAASVAIAVLVVFICPFTFGPPAPQIEKTILPALFAFSAAIVLLLLARNAFSCRAETSFPGERLCGDDTLAVICTRLC
jgi:hypothetical protein